MNMTLYKYTNISYIYIIELLRNKSLKIEIILF